jgi:hypothetical protein
MRSPARCVAKKAAVGWSFWQLSDRWFFSIQYWFFDSSFFWISGIFQYQRFFVFFSAWGSNFSERWQQGRSLGQAIEDMLRSLSGMGFSPEFLGTKAYRIC